MAPLPRWATLRKAKNKNGVKFKSLIDETFNLEKEESYLRHRAYLRSSDIIDQSVKLSMKETFSPLIDDAHNFFGRFFPPNENNVYSDHHMEQRSTGKRSMNNDDKQGDDAPGFKKQKVHEHGYPANSEKSTPPSTPFQLINSNDFYHFPPIILPVAIVRLPLSLLDRSEMVQLFSQGMKTRGNIRNAIVGLKNFGKIGNEPSTGRNYNTSHALLLQEILYQCILQDNSDEFTHLIHHKNRNNIEYVDSLIEWASETESFDSIIVILENAETISNSCLDSFIGILSTLRSKHGIPISLVLITISPLISEQLNSLARCNMNEKVVVKDFHSPPSGDILNRFFELLYTDGHRRSLNLPIILGKTLIKRIRENFNEIHGSLISTSMQIKIALSYYFCVKGSFFGMIHDEKFRRNNWQRLAFFCLDFNAKRYVFESPKVNINVNSSLISKWVNDISDKMKFLSLVCSLVKTFKKSFSSLLMDTNSTYDGSDEKKGVPTFDCNNIIEMHLTRSSSYKDIISNMIGAIRRAPTSKLLDIFSNWKKETESSMSVDSNDTSHFLSSSLLNHNENKNENKSILNIGRSQRFLDFLNEGIILLGEIHNSSKVNSESLLAELRSDLAHEFEFIFEDMPIRVEGNPLSSFFIFEDNNDSVLSSFAKEFEASLCAQPRRMVATSLASSEGDYKCFTDDKPFSHVGREDASIIFKLMKNRVIETSDWFALFIEEALAENHNKVCEKNELLDRFIFAVYELIFCGLLSRNRFRGDAFEKCTLVWASGK